MSVQMPPDVAKPSFIDGLSQYPPLDGPISDGKNVASGYPLAQPKKALAPAPREPAKPPAPHERKQKTIPAHDVELVLSASHITGTASPVIKAAHDHPEVLTKAVEWTAMKLGGKLGADAKSDAKSIVDRSVAACAGSLDVTHAEFEAMIAKIADGKSSGSAPHVESKLVERAFGKLTTLGLVSQLGEDKARALLRDAVSHFISVTAQKVVADLKSLKPK
jgi:hypothetical protein